MEVKSVLRIGSAHNNARNLQCEHCHRIKISYRRATQRCNVSSFFYAKICSLLARKRSSQPVQRVYWPENVIDWLGKWRPTCVMRHARGQKLQSFRRKLPLYMDLYSKTLPKFRMFRIFLNINSISYSFRGIANQNGVRYSDSTSYFKKYSSSKCKQTVCLHYGLDFHFKCSPTDLIFTNTKIIDVLVF